jgi:hypothetical protein
MKRLISGETLNKGVPIGLVATLVCVPYVWVTSSSPSLRAAQLWFLPLVTIVLSQVTVAWGEPPRPWREQLRLALGLALPAGLLLGAVYTLGEDRYMLQFLRQKYPKEVGEVLLALPWVGVFQALFAVTGAYAFAVRLFHTRTAGLVAVVLVHQGLLILQFRGELPLEILVLGVVFAGLHGLVLGWSYIAVGFSGPVVVAMVCHLRHLVRILHS